MKNREMPNGRIIENLLLPESYRFYRYSSGVSNQRPFPFTNAERISKFK